MTRSLLANWAILVPLALAGLSACHRDATTAQTASSSAPKPPGLEPQRSFTDSEVNAAVLATLARDPGVDATGIHAKTTQGIVELTGRADNLLTKRRACAWQRPCAACARSAIKRSCTSQAERTRT